MGQTEDTPMVSRDEALYALRATAAEADRARAEAEQAPRDQSNWPVLQARMRCAERELQDAATSYVRDHLLRSPRQVFGRADLYEKLRLTMDYTFGKGRSRDEIVEAVVDRVFEELPDPATSGGGSREGYYLGEAQRLALLVRSLGGDPEPPARDWHSRIDDCYSASRPCTHQKADPYSLCEACERVHALGQKVDTERVEERPADYRDAVLQDVYEQLKDLRRRFDVLYEEIARRDERERDLDAEISRLRASVSRASLHGGVLK